MTAKEPLSDLSLISCLLLSVVFLIVISVMSASNCFIVLLWELLGRLFAY